MPKFMVILAAISDTLAMPRLNQGNQKTEKPLINPSPQLVKPPKERRATNRNAVFYPLSSKKAPNFPFGAVRPSRRNPLPLVNGTCFPP
jgi:hypothetical protein